MINERETTLWRMYEKGIAYQSQTGIRQKVPQNVDFFEGRQWPEATENTKNLPRPVVNIIKMICRNKKAAILSSPVRLIYKSFSANIDVAKFNRFAEYTQKDLKQEKLDNKAIFDGVKKGSYFYHYYWDRDAKGINGEIEGALRGEIIDILNIFFENPCEKDEQKQKWILIASRENIDTVRAMADKDVNPDDIVSDNYDNNAYNTKEQDEDSRCTVLTRYFRKDGEVYCEKATKSVVVKAPFRITPDREGAKRQILNEDAANNNLPDDVMSDKTIPRAELYPIVAGSYEEAESSIYGISEVESLITNQKAINFQIAMSLLNAQENAWGKYIAMPNALKGQKITNTPGQVLIDYSGTGNGIKKMTEQAIHSIPMDAAELLINLTRNMSGASEVVSGELPSAGMSGAAIAMLQGQAQVPIEDLRNGFWLVKQKIGLILAQFMKQYYFKQEFFYEDEVEGSTEKETKSDEFSSSDYANAKFDIVVEATQGTRSSIASDISMLDTALGKGLIDLETYIKAYPDCAIGNKSELLKHIEMQKKGKLANALATIKEMEQRMEQIIGSYTELQKIVNNIMPTIQQNQKQREFISELALELQKLGGDYAHYMQAAKAFEAEATAVLKQKQAEIDYHKGEATAFAEDILKNSELNEQTAVSGQQSE